ncbi:fluoride efflux transporter CrcB [Streptomyces thermocarboxydus]|uniref:fluoride efflux transporter CrcB n=1 Tax=Streptomyces TaxID=1883 RepID=UPI00167727A1|nr:fluoride efflux transporter CrcB [Streptomyces thermocarboxydus]GHE56738.1 putative fluoride ion transporter CrcB 1 [Streptomyces cellulosae]
MTAADTGRPRGRSAVRAQAPVVAAVAVGGGVGAAARYAAVVWWPTPAGSFPWTILWVNVLGCAVIGAFMVTVTEARAAHRLLRPFFGTGVLGGFTTFSTYAVDVRGLFEAGRPGSAVLCLAATPVVALTAVWAATTATRRALIRRQS